MANTERVSMETPGRERITDVTGVVRDVVRQWPSILMTTAAVVLFTYSLLITFRKPQYKSVSNVAIANIYENVTAINSAVVNDYEILNEGVDNAIRIVNIIGSNEWGETVAEEELGGNEFTGELTVDRPTDTNLLTFTVVTDSPVSAYQENMAVIRCLKKNTRDLVGGYSIKVLKYPKVPEAAADAAGNIKYSIFAGLVALFVTVVLIIICSLLKDSVHSRREAEGKLDAPVLMTISLPKEKSRGIIRSDKNGAACLTSMNMAASRIINELDDRGRKILLVAGYSKLDGAVPAAAELALEMSRNDRKVVLADMDFREPALYKLLNMRDTEFPELSTSLEPDGNRNLADVQNLVCRIPGTELEAVLNRTAVSGAMEMHTDAISKMITSLGESADFVVISCAAYEQQYDAEELAKIADASLIMVRLGADSASGINDMIRALGRDKVLGVILEDDSRLPFKNADRKGYDAEYGGSYAG